MSASGVLPTACKTAIRCKTLDMSSKVEAEFKPCRRKASEIATTDLPSPLAKASINWNT